MMPLDRIGVLSPIRIGVQSFNYSTPRKRFCTKSSWQQNVIVPCYGKALDRLCHGKRGDKVIGGRLAHSAAGFWRTKGRVWQSSKEQRKHFQRRKTLDSKLSGAPHCNKSAKISY